MPQLTHDPLQAGREAVRRQAWSEGYELLRAADEGGELDPADLELLASAAQWVGRHEDVLDYWERAYVRYVQAGVKARAAFVATELSHAYKNNLQASVANGWLSRAKRLLDEIDEAPEHGYWALQRSLVALGAHDFEESVAQGKRAEEIGRRFGDRSLEVRGLQRQGAALIEKGDVAEGKLLLDEASAAALGGELDPFSTLVVYCNTIGACREVSDFDSAGQWTDRATELCDAHSMSAFPGMCRVNYAEVMRFKGRFTEAQELAGRAGEELRAWCPRIAGAAFYELGEARLRLGELAQAEQAFREADEYGRDPEPGRSLLRLARGDAKGALASMRRVLADETVGLAARTPFLSAAIDIAVAAEDLELAERWAGWLAQAADMFETSALKAASAYARGKIRRAEGDPDGAYGCFRQARTLWESTGATYDVARVREQLGLVLRESGDQEAAVWEFQAAAARFERLGAVLDADRLAEHLVRDTTQEVMRTFLFTDIVKSTDLLATIEDRHWANALRLHDDALRAVFAGHDGQVVDHTGDGFFAAFEEAGQAVEAAMAVQRAVDQEFVFDVRVGVHTDGALQKAGNYHGRGVHAAARIGAAAQGREILASRDTMDLLPQYPTVDARTVVLKGFREPVEVCTIEWR